MAVVMRRKPKPASKHGVPNDLAVQRQQANQSGNDFFAKSLSLVAPHPLRASRTRMAGNK
jgi:hypothetical protein